MVPIGDVAVSAIRDYIEHGRNEICKVPGSLLFYNYKGEAISRQGFFKYVKNLAIDNGITKRLHHIQFVIALQPTFLKMEQI